jgi:hypothetical protein
MLFLPLLSTYYDQVMGELKTIEPTDALSLKLKEDIASHESIRNIEASYSKLLQGIPFITTMKDSKLFP